MLVGRESLVRLVGKRKRTLSSPAAASLSSEPPNFDGQDCATCAPSRPSISAAESRHDFCLSSPRKRKTSQRTLLQLNFLSKESKKTCPGVSVADNETKNSGSFYTEAFSDCSFKVSSCSSKWELYTQTNGISVEDKSCKVDEVNKRTIGPFLSTDKSETGEKWISRNGEDVVVLDASIVGHRFYDTIDLWPGARVSVVREPDNSVDQNAIKILYAFSGREQTVGHLPRQLASYLSPLIDNYALNVEGYVTALPTHPRDVFRIDLICQKTISYSEMKPEKIQIFESLWENFIRVAESEKFLTNRTKYQQNFLLMINEVREQYAQLLNDEERLYLDSFGALCDDSQRLFLRLYARKGPWFRICNISYAEVADSEKAVEELQTAGFVSMFQYDQNPKKSDLKEVICTLTLSELREISKTMMLKKGLSNHKKDDLIHILWAAFGGGTCPSLPRVVSEMVGSCVRISSVSDSLLWRVQRLFFLNGEQDLSAFLLADLGLVKYPNYTCSIALPIFRSRNDFAAYEEAIEAAQIMDESLEKSDFGRVNRCIELADNYLSLGSGAEYQKQFLYQFSASWVYAKVVTLGVSFLESEKRYEDAVKLLRGLLQKCPQDRKRGYWALRLSVDLEHLGFANESLSVAEEAIQDPLVRAGWKLGLQKRVLRLGKPPRRWKIPDFAAFLRRKLPEVQVKGRPLNCKTGAKNRYYGYNGKQCGVEQLALQYYAGEGGCWSGVHTESGIWLTVFGLLMWDVLFANVPDVFRSRFQTAPLDLESEDFYSSRKDQIESRLQDIEEGMAEEILIISWESNLHTACRGVRWDRHDLSDLRAAVSCIGGRGLAAICRLLATDYRTWSSGMPDLFLWRFRKGEDNRSIVVGEAKLVEVKGPRDKLSDQQHAWMIFLLDSGVDAEICWVSPTTKMAAGKGVDGT